MANCRKCGAKKITKRSAGVFFCQHCGMQPGELRMDRFGNVPAIKGVNLDDAPLETENTE